MLRVLLIAGHALGAEIKNQEIRRLIFRRAPRTASASIAGPFSACCDQYREETVCALALLFRSYDLSTAGLATEFLREDNVILLSVVVSEM